MVGTLYCRIMDADQMRRLAHQNQRDKAREEASYAALVAAIWEAHDAGWRQFEIVREVGLTRERVRQICDPEYRKRRVARSPSS
jgi:hypothetical protein